MSLFMRSLTRYSHNEVEGAFNRAADDILDAIDAPDTGVRDAINLVVNAGLHYLAADVDFQARIRDHTPTLEEAIKANYTIREGENGPLEWIKEGLR